MSYQPTRSTLVLVAVTALATVVVAGVPGVLAANAADSSPSDAVADRSAAATMIVESATADAGETVTVPVVVEGDSIAGYQANVTWDPAVLRYESVEGVDLADPVTNDGDGWVFMTQSQTEGVSSPTVVRLTFTVVGDAGAETALSLVPADSSANNESTQLQTALEHGSVTVSGDGSNVGGDSVDGESTNGTADDGSDDGSSGSDDADGASNDGSTAGADGGTDDDGLSPMLLILGLVGVGVVLGTGYALGQRGGSAEGDA